MTTTEGKKYRTITLTDRAPVRICEDNWFVLASASYYDYEGQYDFQSNRHWRGAIFVRQHEDDGRTIVHATASYSTVWQDENDYAYRAGELLPSATTEQIIAAIKRVHASIDCDHRCWRTLAAECIADLPAVDLDAEEPTEAQS